MASILFAHARVVEKRRIQLTHKPYEGSELTDSKCWAVPSERELKRSWWEGDDPAEADGRSGSRRASAHTAQSPPREAEIKRARCRSESKTRLTQTSVRPVFRCSEGKKASNHTASAVYKLKRYGSSLGKINLNLDNFILQLFHLVHGCLHSFVALLPLHQFGSNAGRCRVDLKCAKRTISKFQGYYLMVRIGNGRR